MSSRIHHNWLKTESTKAGLGFGAFFLMSFSAARSFYFTGRLAPDRELISPPTMSRIPAVSIVANTGIDAEFDGATPVSGS